ncbi:hypothetical protein [Shewanella waksmanii]|uniref:hypothetical protein n=1 Tax=Shewanella waksmanii TaxID=213783 RepID=UPI003736788C
MNRNILGLQVLLIGMIAMVMSGCASGQLDILDEQGNVIGECNAEFNFHLHGAQASVDYLLYLCAKEHVQKGRVVSNSAILHRDFSFPPPKHGQNWNSLLAHDAFSTNEITELQLGYIFAAIEYRYWQQVNHAKAQLAQGVIDDAQYRRQVQLARIEFKGE